MGDSGRYTRAEVAARNGKNNSPMWIIIRDAVYDVTNYIHEHPGGGDMIVEVAGTDCTKDFDSATHSSDALSILPKYRIGEIVEEEKHYDANGKKKKKTKVVSAAPEGKNNRSCFNIVTCGLIG